MKMVLEEKLPNNNPLRQEISAVYREDETKCLESLLAAATLPDYKIESIRQRAKELVISIREQRLGRGGIDAFMVQYDLSSDEGVALMCLAEAMLRVPDAQTVDKLIREKITSGDWIMHKGESESLFVNATTWGLMLTGSILRKDEKQDGYFSAVVKRAASRIGEPMIRKAVFEGMKILGRQFVRGRTIEEALNRAGKLEEIGYKFSYDMLGEAAYTANDAARYFVAYEKAIKNIGEYAKNQGVIESPGISVKLSALYPRFEFSKREEALPILIERLLALSQLAEKYNIGLTVDAEEANRLGFSLDIIEAVFKDPSLKQWDGFGLAVQAYQKRAFPLIDWLGDLAMKTDKRLFVRLVKGAYWDTEIKDSQVGGFEGYPVFTRKASTDVSYIACAKKLVDAGDLFYPQFATHNAYTVAVVLELMGQRRNFEFQALQGMSRSLYDQIVSKKENGYSCRIYAPVGKHEDLLPYLVRRLLENGANSSFVNRIVDEKAPIEDLIADPVAKISELKSKPHPHIPIPANIYGRFRKNSQGLDLSNGRILNKLAEEMSAYNEQQWTAGPMAVKSSEDRQVVIVTEPANCKNVVGSVTEATLEDVQAALKRAEATSFAWDQLSFKERYKILLNIANVFEENRTELMALAVREAGKTLPDALSEVREAVDFCRYYAEQGRHVMKTRTLIGPTGESNEIQMHGRGVFCCISPWNFPLAIFTGQVSAALMTGNAVIAKPAEQTTLIAARAVELMHEAGVPKDVLQLLPGRGEVVGATIVADPCIKGVVFTGSTETAHIINLTLANRKGALSTLIAETGGQNAMLVDSTALPEQVITDVIASAFGSAGQRCSALRVLFLQEEIADKMLAMLTGAMAEIEVGDPRWLKTDVGPVIDDDAKKMLEAHAKKMKKLSKLIYEVTLPKACKNGTFFAPRAFEIKNLDVLNREVFGPILHIVRYKSEELDKIIDAINNTEYGLTLGVHTRIDSVADYIQSRTKVGNVYVNRNIIGAVVGVQPFGGEGLSGTGPKAGGPHYLSRFCTERVMTINTTATGGNAALMALGE